MKKKILFLSLAAITVLSISCKKEGCTDELAENYNKKADVDDGSCKYADNVISFEITENITVPTTFEAKNYKICSDISVTSGLTIMPGAKLIMCEGSSITIKTGGFLNAVGTAEKPIIIRGKTETKGFWQGIAIKSTNPSNKLSYVTVKDAGTYWAWEFANIYVTGSLSIDHSTVSNSDNIGLYIDGNAALNDFNNNTFSNSTTGLNLNVKHISKLDTESNYNNNNINDFIFARKGTIGVNSTWKKTNTPILVEEINCDAGLTIMPGSVLKMEAGFFGIRVNSSGFLNCTGTASEPIIIQGRFSTAAYWEGIKITANNPNNKFNHTTISDGGKYWAYKHANVYINGGRLEIDNSTISNANSYGIFVESNAQIFTSGSVQTTALGVEANNTFSNNGTGPNASCTSGCTIFFD